MRSVVQWSDGRGLDFGYVVYLWSVPFDSTPSLR